MSQRLNTKAKRRVRFPVRLDKLSAKHGEQVFKACPHSDVMCDRKFGIAIYQDGYRAGWLEAMGRPYKLKGDS